MTYHGIRNSQLGKFASGSPGFTGKLNCKCVIWHNCPFYKRVHQDQHFIFSPETISQLPLSIKDKIKSIDGHDGVYLSPLWEYKDNFMASISKKNEDDASDENRSRQNLRNDPDGVISLSKLEFIETPRADLVSSIIEFTGRQAKTKSAEASHHMWLDVGSIFTNETFLPSEVDQPLSDKLKDLKRQFSPRWDYNLYNVPSSDQKTSTVTTSNASTQSVIDVGTFRHLPRQVKISQYEPSTQIEKLRTDGVDVSSITISKEKKQYKNINPGIHWAAEKRTPLFQGEDFWIEFHRHSTSTDIAVKQKSNFSIIDEYAFLDVFGLYQSGGLGGVISEGLLGIGNNQEKIDEQKSKFDFASQSYYIIEIGHRHSKHNYYIILAQKQNPIFCHFGTVYTTENDPTDINLPSQTETEGQTADGDEGQEDCNDQQASENTNSGGQTTSASPVKRPTLRKLSTFSIPSDQLIKQNKLRISVRNHMGKIVVTFSGYEDNPWVISRFDLTAGNLSPEDVETIDDLQTEKVWMVVPRERMRVMGGNLGMVSFNFSPLLYSDSETKSFTLNQKLSVLGPANIREVQLLLRDKGTAKDIQKGPLYNSIDFSHDAQVFSEWFNNKFLDTEAIKIARKFVEQNGKAPDMQKLGKKSKLRESHSISVSAKDCSQRIGSQTPYVKSIQVNIGLVAGDYLFSPPVGDGGEKWKLDNCITPIFTGFRLFVPPYGDAFDTDPIDVGHHVMNISESWQEEDLLKINHGGRISFLVNPGMDKRFDDDRPNYANYLRSLVDKNFYVQISVWWGGDDIDESDGNTRTRSRNINGDRYMVMPTPPREQDRVIFTGICTNGQINVENNKHVMTCDLQDYTKAMKEQTILNSPFFDKMTDFNAVNEIIQLAGFKDGQNYNSRIIGNLTGPGSIGTDNSQPASLMARLAATDQTGWFQLIHNGESVFNQPFALPGSYDILHEPQFRFSDGSNLYDAVSKISQVSGKVIYFDRLGVFHYEKLPYDQALFAGEEASSDAISTVWEQFSKIDFFASPKDDADGIELHRQAFDAYTVSRDMDSVINSIHIMSNTPDGELLLAGHRNFDSIFDKDKPGFVGYPKTLSIIEGVLGDEQNVKWLVKHYTKLFLPPIKVRFKAYGHNLLKALDIVTFKGLGWRDKQVLIVGSVESEIDPASNTWWQTFECYWIFPSQNINWQASNEIDTGPDITGG